MKGIFLLVFIQKWNLNDWVPAKSEFNYICSEDFLGSQLCQHGINLINVSPC
jgi:hypothetical protein